jgi:hypothetical protein
METASVTFPEYSRKTLLVDFSIFNLGEPGWGSETDFESFCGIQKEVIC